MMTGGEWWADCGEIARLLRWLWEEEDIEMAEAIEVVAKPWHWDDEYQEMCREQGERGNPGITRAKGRGDEDDLLGMLEASLGVVRAHKAGGGR